MRVGTSIEVSIGHRLMDYVGKCAFLHGHNYKIEVWADDTWVAIPPDGIALDFSELKRLLGNILEPFDHAVMLREDDPIADGLSFNMHQRVVRMKHNPTAECFAMWIRDQFYKAMPNLAWHVRVWETSKSYAEV